MQISSVPANTQTVDWTHGIFECSDGDAFPYPERPPDLTFRPSSPFPSNAPRAGSSSLSLSCRLRRGPRLLLGQPLHKCRTNHHRLFGSRLSRFSLRRVALPFPSSEPKRNGFAPDGRDRECSEWKNIVRYALQFLMAALNRRVLSPVAAAVSTEDRGSPGRKDPPRKRF